jgi:hypothetical protein
VQHLHQGRRIERGAAAAGWKGRSVLAVCPPFGLVGAANRGIIMWKQWASLIMKHRSRSEGEGRCSGAEGSALLAWWLVGT